VVIAVYASVLCQLPPADSWVIINAHGKEVPSIKADSKVPCRFNVATSLMFTEISLSPLMSVPLIRQAAEEETPLKKRLKLPPAPPLKLEILKCA
jgi:hypothetical protein